MRSATNLLRKIADGIDLNAFSIFLAKYSHCAMRLRVCKSHLFAIDFNIRLYLSINEPLNFKLLLVGHFFAMREIESQSLGSYIAAFLINMISQYNSQSSKKHVSRGV